MVSNIAVTGSGGFNSWKSVLPAPSMQYSQQHYCFAIVALAVASSFRWFVGHLMAVFLVYVCENGSIYSDGAHDDDDLDGYKIMMI